MIQHLVQTFSRVRKARKHLTKVIISCIGAFIGIFTLSILNSLLFSPQETGLLIGSFGSSAILIFGDPRNKTARPLNVLVGQVSSAFIGVSMYYLLGNEIWIAVPLALFFSLLFMKLTGTTHAPAGATAIIAILGGENIHRLSYGFVIFPVLSAMVILLLISILLKRIVKQMNLY